MIEKKRLEELIEQGATIYYYNPNAVNLYNLSNTPNIIGLGKMGTAIVGDKLETFIPRFYSNGRMEKDYRNIYNLEYLFEDKEKFDWLLEFGNIERTEKLSLPTWEEFKKEKYFEFVGANNTWYDISMRYNKICIQYSNDGEYFVDYYDWKKIDATKENYLEACRLAKKLFLGEKYD